MPLIELLTIEAIQKKPAIWEDIFNKCNVPKEGGIDDTITLNTFKELDLLQHREILEEISKNAKDQYEIEKKLSKMNETVKNLQLELIPHKSG
mmetsp:Transcript_23916/g.20893  ORF Transcript_23916/g.20893 Transcript_23916/m.20893 type:complete len:93 (-) Transcript_23916:1600-1878(-)